MPGDISVAAAVPADLVYIHSLQRKNAEELSFYPRIVFEREIDNRRVVLARVNAEPAGYIYHGALGTTCRIHQACIQYDLRGQLYGAALIRWLRDLADAAGCHRVTLRCGSDIEANGFWKAMGFECEFVSQGGIRRMRDINHWALNLQTPLFVSSVAPSERKQNSSVWAARKIAAPSQFIRGRQKRQYRALIEGTKP